jgi:hypothetical protein
MFGNEVAGDIKYDAEEGEPKAEQVDRDDGGAAYDQNDFLGDAQEEVGLVHAFVDRKRIVLQGHKKLL